MLRSMVLYKKRQKDQGGKDMTTSVI